MAVKGRYVMDKEYIVVQVFVGQPAEFPVVRERAVTLQPGREHFLEMAAYTVTTDQEAESLDVQYRSHLALPVIPFMYHYVKCAGSATPGARASWSTTACTPTAAASSSAASAAPSSWRAACPGTCPSPRPGDQSQHDTRSRDPVLSFYWSGEASCATPGRPNNSSKQYRWV